jgi:hypothetical protein
MGFTREAEMNGSPRPQRVLQRETAVFSSRCSPRVDAETGGCLALLMRLARSKRRLHRRLGTVFTEIYDLQAHRTHRQHSAPQLRKRSI